MRLTKEELSTRVVVRRVRRGAAPFVWEINTENRVEPLYVSPDGFRSMEDAYRAGNARLREFVPSPRSLQAMVDEPAWQSTHAGAAALDQAVAGGAGYPPAGV
jgi:hypothetical protein